MDVVFLSAVKGGFFFHPSDEDLSLGIPAEKATWLCAFGLHQFRKCYYEIQEKHRTKRNRKRRQEHYFAPAFLIRRSEIQLES